MTIKFTWLHFPQLASTHLFAKQNAIKFSSNSQLSDGATHQIRALITCSEQTRGVGRRGNCWQSLPGDLMATFVIEAFIPWRFLPLGQVTLTLACALFDTINWALQNAQVDLWIKWPNDLYVKHLKLAGVMAEFLEDEKFAMASFGLNIPKRAQKTHLKFCSLASCTPRQVPSASKMAAKLTESLDKHLLQLMSFKKAAFELQHLGGKATKGSELLFSYCENRSSPHRGIFLGIDDQGRLIIAQGNTISHLSLDQICKISFSPSL